MTGSVRVLVMISTTRSLHQEVTCKHQISIYLWCSSSHSFYWLGSTLVLTHSKRMKIISFFRFQPESLGYIYTKSMFLWIIETLVLKGAFYFLGIAGTSEQTPPFFELFSYTGYKFVSLCLIVIAQLVFGTLASYLVLFLTGGMFAFFFHQSLKMHCQVGNTLADHMKDSSMNRKTIIFVCSVGQIFIIWLLSINWLH